MPPTDKPTTPAAPTEPAASRAARLTAAAHLRYLAGEARRVGDLQLLRITDRGVEPSIGLADALEVIALDLAGADKVPAHAATHIAAATDPNAEPAASAFPFVPGDRITNVAWNDNQWVEIDRRKDGGDAAEFTGIDESGNLVKIEVSKRQHNDWRRAKRDAKK